MTSSCQTTQLASCVEVIGGVDHRQSDLESNTLVTRTSPNAGFTTVQQGIGLTALSLT
jgi:hypothetical protein